AAPWEHTEPIVTGPSNTDWTAGIFLEVTEEAGITEAAPTQYRGMIVDFDGDGRDDIVTLAATVTAPAKMNPRFTRNAGPNDAGQVRFEDVTSATGMADAEAAIMVFADVDNDGDQDIFTGVSFRAPDGIAGIWTNDGTGTFSLSGTNGINGGYVGQNGANRFYNEMAAAGFADFDGDGILDLYVGNWYVGSEGGQSAPTDDTLYRGMGNSVFEAVTLPAQTNPLTAQVAPDLAGVGRAAYGLSIADFDDDGDMDLFVNNYGAGRPAGNSPPRYWDHNFLWRNDGNMVFTDVGVTAGVAATTRGIGGVEEETTVRLGGEDFPGPIGGNGFGCQWGDLNNDGRLDLVVGTIAHPDYPQSDRTMLHYNQGDGTFSEESAARGLEYNEDELHPALIDVDNDGRLDFAMSRLRGEGKWEFYNQADDGNFVQRTHAESGVDIGRPSATLWLDYDGDGDLDMFMPKGTGRLFENTLGQNNNALEIRLVATAPKDATGARITLTTSVGTQVREVTSGNGHYNSQLSRGQYFGLGQDSGAADVTIRWPNGEVQVLGNVRANYALEVTQGGAIEILRGTE
ncbi:MAG: hypothetical protein ACI9MR_002520, partial [Myxococcota bacterium]